MKSGVYKRVLNTGRVNNVTETSQNNLYFSTNERNGAILSAKQFDQLYTMNDTDNAAKSRIYQYDIKSAEIISGVPVSVENSSYITQRTLYEEQPCFEDSLNLEYNISSLSKRNKTDVNKKSNQILYKDKDLNKKTIYKIVYPDSLDLENTSLIKRNCTASNENVNSFKSAEPIRLLSKSHNRTRHKKILNKMVEAEALQKIPTITSTTRYGRVSTQSKFIQKLFKLSENEKTQCESNFVIDYDKDYKYSGAKLSDLKTVPIQRTKRERNLSPNYRCTYCHKIYLGKRMQRHWEANPDHNIVLESKKEDNILSKCSLFTFLVKKLKQSPEENRAEVFLAEITDLVDQLQSRGSRFLRNTSGIHLVNSQLSRVLGIPEGHYSIDVSAIECTPETDSTNETESHIIPPPSRLDYNLSISLDDTISDGKLNLSDNIVSSEESLLRTVNDLVEQGMTTLSEHEEGINHGQAPSINYDHASDNAVEAVTIKTEQAAPILDLSLDLFQFSSS